MAAASLTRISFRESATSLVCLRPELAVVYEMELVEDGQRLVSEAHCVARVASDSALSGSEEMFGCVLRMPAMDRGHLAQVARDLHVGWECLAVARTIAKRKCDRLVPIGPLRGRDDAIDRPSRRLGLELLDPVRVVDEVPSARDREESVDFVQVAVGYPPEEVAVDLRAHHGRDVENLALVGVQSCDSCPNELLRGL